jgi:glucosyl-dolichyl phosphate glucuronosyltransferase
MNDMKLTVVICTWNRAKLLNQTLSRMIELCIPRGVTWELLVVNNNSTDNTESVLAYYADRLPIRKVFEATPGLSNARNRAIREVQGDLILWTDDDVLVDNDWIAAYATAAQRWPIAAFFGGPIEPWFEGEPPRWLQQIYSRVENSFAARNLGREPRLLNDGKFPFGANMAVRTTEQRRYLFNPELGLRPSSRLLGEESVLFEEMTRNGLEGRWVPEAKVQHFIPKSRQTIKYLRSYYRGYGQYCTLKTNQEPGARLFGRPRWMWRKAVENDMLFYLKRLCFKPESWIDNLIQANTAWGNLFPPVSNRTKIHKSSVGK